VIYNSRVERVLGFGVLRADALAGLNIRVLLVPTVWLAPVAAVFGL
jgi:hypothetical protein